jgi:hypothetical protein
MTDRIISFWSSYATTQQKFQGSRREGHNRDHFEYVLEALASQVGGVLNIVWDKVKNRRTYMNLSQRLIYRDMNLFIPPMRSI